jgi:glycosyltransferase involved in cell wall biosynthesis
LLKPKSQNKYIAHLWNHFILPFKKGNILFCPANIAPFFVPKKKKLVITLHDMAFITHSESFSPFFRNYYKCLIPKVIQRADKIITISQTSRKEIIKYYPHTKDKIEVVFLGLDKTFYLLPNIEKKDQILYVGSLNMRKNFISVIQAFKKLNNNKFQLLIVGNFSSNYNLSQATQSILDEAKINPNINFLSNITDDELRLLYNESKLFLFPSFYEGFGLPPLEAMACGTPVITSNISSMPEVCGNAAIYVDPYNIEDITQKLSMLLNNNVLHQKMINKGLEHVKHFTWEKAANKHLKVFNEVLNR